MLRIFLRGVKSLVAQNMARALAMLFGENACMSYNRTHIAELIEQYVAEDGNAIRKLARQADISESSIRAFLTDATKSLRVDTAYKIAEAMGLQIWEFLGEPPPGDAQELIRELQEIVGEQLEGQRKMEALAATLARLRGSYPKLLPPPKEGPNGGAETSVRP